MSRSASFALAAALAVEPLDTVVMRHDQAVAAAK
jgi:hypothetical protein